MPSLDAEFSENTSAACSPSSHLKVKGTMATIGGIAGAALGYGALRLSAGPWV